MKPQRTFWLVGLVILAAVFLRYWPYLFSGFWEDDFVFLKQVPPFHPRDLPDFFSPLRGWFYRPVFLVYFSLILRVFGADPVAFHAASLVLHALNLTLLAFLMRRLAGNSRSVNFAIVCALIGLLFYPGIAPTGTGFGERGISAVIWISSASTLLATLFSLLCLHLWLSFQRHGERRFYLAAWVAFFAALLSKEDAAALPLALLSLDLAFGPPKKWAARAKEYAPFGVAFLLFAILDIVAYKQFQVFGSGELAGPLNYARYRLALQFLDGVLLNIWPRAVVWIIVGAAAIFVWAWRYDRSVAFFWAWLCASAFPCPLMSGPHALAARFYYLPAFAAVAALALLLRNVANNDEKYAQFGRCLLPLTLLAGFIALPIGKHYFDQIADPALVWFCIAVLIGMAWLFWRSGRWPGALLVALIISCVGSQCEIYGSDTLNWPLLCLFLAAVALRGRRGAPEAWLALALAWSQPVLYWLTLAMLVESHRAVGGALMRKMQLLPAPGQSH